MQASYKRFCYSTLGLICDILSYFILLLACLVNKVWIQNSRCFLQRLSSDDKNATSGIKVINPLFTGNLKQVLWQTAMQHKAAFHQGMHCLLRLKQPSGTEIQYNLDYSSHDPLKYTMGSSPIRIVSICMANSIRLQNV